MCGHCSASNKVGWMCIDSLQTTFRVRSYWQYMLNVLLSLYIFNSLFLDHKPFNELSQVGIILLFMYANEHKPTWWMVGLFFCCNSTTWTIILVFIIGSTSKTNKDYESNLLQTLEIIAIMDVLLMCTTQYVWTTRIMSAMTIYYATKLTKFRVFQRRMELKRRLMHRRSNIQTTRLPN